MDEKTFCLSDSDKKLIKAILEEYYTDSVFDHMRFFDDLYSSTFYAFIAGYAPKKTIAKCFHIVMFMRDSYIGNREFYKEYLKSAGV